MKAFTQLIARFSILCYLVVASIAAAHAFPMSSAMGSNNTLMTMDVALDDSQALIAEETVSMDEMQADCHQSKTVSSDVGSASLCKIFCSAIGHAVTSEMIFIMASIMPPAQNHTLIDDFSTRQVSVEHHPPI